MSSNLPAIRSLRSDLMSSVKFISRTRRQVAIYWVNFQGSLERYGVLNYGEPYQLNTYETHPWIFRDKKTGDGLVTSEGHEIFWPRPWDGVHQDTVIIGIPVYTLKEKCLQVVRQLLPSEVIQSLLIPLTLKDDLLREADSTPFTVHVNS